METDQDEWNDVDTCIDCGAPLDYATDRRYDGDGRWALCSECASERGARYDENEGYWIVPPDVTGLVVDREHRTR